MSNWRRVDDLPSYQSFDGSGHFTFYDSYRTLSFTWDGMSEYIQVSHGGYGEPVEWVIPAFVFHGTPGECLRAFEKHCLNMIPEWDQNIWDDKNYQYSEIHSHCGYVERHIPIPKGRNVWFYNREKMSMDKRSA